jgi:hypothetical protein
LVELNTPRKPPVAPRELLLGEMKKVRPSPLDPGFWLVIEKENLVEKEAEVLVTGSKNWIGRFKITDPALEEGTLVSFVKPIEPFLR